MEHRRLVGDGLAACHRLGLAPIVLPVRPCPADGSRDSAGMGAGAAEAVAWGQQLRRARRWAPAQAAPAAAEGTRGTRAACGGARTVELQVAEALQRCGVVVAAVIARHRLHAGQQRSRSSAELGIVGALSSLRESSSRQAGGCSCASRRWSPACPTSAPTSARAASSRRSRRPRSRASPSETAAACPAGAGGCLRVSAQRERGVSRVRGGGGSKQVAGAAWLGGADRMDGLAPHQQHCHYCLRW